jgi:hypothetical protein
MTSGRRGGQPQAAVVTAERAPVLTRDGGRRWAALFFVVSLT